MWWQQHYSFFKTKILPTHFWVEVFLGTLFIIILASGFGFWIGILTYCFFSRTRLWELHQPRRQGLPPPGPRPRPRHRHRPRPRHRRRRRRRARMSAGRLRSGRRGTIGGVPRLGRTGSVAAAGTGPLTTRLQRPRLQRVRLRPPRLQRPVPHRVQRPFPHRLQRPVPPRLQRPVPHRLPRPRPHRLVWPMVPRRGGGRRPSAKIYKAIPWMCLHWFV